MSTATPAPPEAGGPDIATILEQLRAEVRAQRAAAGTDQLSAVERDLQRSLDEIELHRVVSAHWPLRSRSLAERLINLANKIVRRLLRWYINPIVEQQNAYNDAVARALRLLADAYLDLREDLARPASAGDEGPEPPGGDPRPAPPATAEGAADPSIQRLQELVAERGAAEPPARFIELDLVAQEQQLGLREQVRAHWPLPARTPAERFAALAQMGTRRYLRWLVNPIVEQQNNANAAFSAAVRRMIDLDAERRAEVAARRAGRGDR